MREKWFLVRAGSAARFVNAHIQRTYVSSREAGLEELQTASVDGRTGDLPVVVNQVVERVTYMSDSVGS